MSKIDPTHAFMKITDYWVREKQYLHRCLDVNCESSMKINTVCYESMMVECLH